MVMKESIKTYHEAVSFIESLSNISAMEGRSKKRAEEHVEKVRDFLRFLGNPEKKLKIIHIAGTSGKGSVANMLQNILSSAGNIAGLYTSPHTTTYCERIKIGDKYIGEKELVGLVNFLKNKMDESLASSPFPRGRQGGGYSFNFFEFTFILAILYFKKMKCEYAVIETGLGGRRDTTNAIQKPIYTIITNIGRDHLDVIGPALKDVAKEKAGIIKRGAPLLTGEKRKNLLKIFMRECAKHNTKYIILNTKNIKNIKINLDGTKFKYKDEDYKLRLLGEHQAKNAALAIECAKDLNMPQTAIKAGLLNAQYPARLEVILKHPLIILDGAHNEDKIRAGLDFILKIKNQKSKIKNYLIMAMAKNKKVNILPEFFKYFDKIYLTRFSNPFRKCRGLSDWLQAIPNNERKKTKYFHAAKDALLDILPRMRDNDLLMITGSIFLAGELREYWYPEDKIIKTRKSTF